MNEGDDRKGDGLAPKKLEETLMDDENRRMKERDVKIDEPKATTRNDAVSKMETARWEIRNSTTGDDVP